MVDASEKYGDGQQMMVAAEPIAAGEKIWWCTCGDDDYVMSRDEILDEMETQPHLKNFLCWYSYMVIQILIISCFFFNFFKFVD